MKYKLLVYGGFSLTTTLISVVLVYAHGSMTADQELARRILLMPGTIIWGLICLPVVHGAEACSFKGLAAAMNVVGYCALALAVKWLFARKKPGNLREH